MSKDDNVNLEPEIQRYLVVSTGHVTPDDMEQLKTPCVVSVDQFEYGTCVHVPDADVADLVVGLAGEGYSDGFIVMMQLAHTLNCQFLKLDEDGPVMDGYPVYDW